MHAVTTSVTPVIQTVKHYFIRHTSDNVTRLKIKHHNVIATCCVTLTVSIANSNGPVSVRPSVSSVYILKVNPQRQHRYTASAHFGPLSKGDFTTNKYRHIKANSWRIGGCVPPIQQEYRPKVASCPLLTGPHI